jgi:excinuclease UvrABC nuclease subunit
MSTWRPIGVAGVFADWILDLHGHSGVYAIRDAYSRGVWYVGESHSGRLYETLTRHFQARSHSYHGPNLDRGRCEAKAEICRVSEVEDLQFDWIKRLDPELNELVPVSKEKVPF